MSGAGVIIHTDTQFFTQGFVIATNFELMETSLTEIANHFKDLGIDQQIDYDKFYLYSIITHSTAIEGSTITEIENRLLFDEGISVHGKSMLEQLMNMDLHTAYTQAIKMAKDHEDFSVEMLCHLSALVMQHTGAEYDTALGNFSAAKGELRLLNVSAGFGGRSYLNYSKVPSYLEEFCQTMNKARHEINPRDVDAVYRLSFDAHYHLVTIHPWADGNGRMARLIMNYIQFEFGLVPSKVDKESKADYIRALECSREQESLQPFRDFMAAHHAQNLLKMMDEYQTSSEHLPNLTEGKSNQESNQKSNQKILEAIRNNPHITINEMHEAIGLSESGVKKVLRKLREEGRLERVGANKDGYWRIID